MTWCGRARAVIARGTGSLACSRWRRWCSGVVGMENAAVHRQSPRHSACAAGLARYQPRSLSADGIGGIRRPLEMESRHGEHHLRVCGRQGRSWLAIRRVDLRPPLGSTLLRSSSGRSAQNTMRLICWPVSSARPSCPATNKLAQAWHSSGVGSIRDALAQSSKITAMTEDNVGNFHSARLLASLVPDTPHNATWHRHPSLNLPSHHV